MKKVITATFIMFLFVGVNNAKAQKGFSLLVKGNPHASWMLNIEDFTNEDIKVELLPGFSTGIGVGYNFSDNFGIAADVLYSMQGGRYKLADHPYNLRVNYLKVPILFSYTTPQLGKVALYGKMGPQASFLLNSKLKNEERDLIHNLNDRFEKITIGGAAGIGVQLSVANNLFLTGGFRLDFDFTNAEKVNNVNYRADRDKSTNMTSGFEIGIKFQL